MWKRFAKEKDKFYDEITLIIFFVHNLEKPVDNLKERLFYLFCSDSIICVLINIIIQIE